MKKTLFTLIMALAFLAYGQPKIHKNTMELQPVSTTQDTLFNFENYAEGNIPAGWTAALTGKGKMCQWRIVNDNGNHVLAQTSSEPPDYRFNIITNNNLIRKEVEISVRFKAVKGLGDMGGGPVWRYVDKNNYYVARANPLEDNYRVYKVVNGNRIQLKSATIHMKSGTWYTLKVVMKGINIKCYFDNKLQYQTIDGTFTKAGKVGLWTKSDAVTYFDDFDVKKLP